MSPEWSTHNYMTLVALPSAPFWARRFAEETLKSWDLSAYFETVELLVSELVTNSVKALGVLTPEPSRDDTTGPATETRLAPEPSGQEGSSSPRWLREGRPSALLIRLRLSTTEARDSLLIQVCDSTSEAPMVKEPELEAEGGRGLWLVELLTARWGWYPVEGLGGKVVWGEVGVAE